MLEELSWFNGTAVIGRIGIAMHIFAGNPSVINIYSEARDQKKYPTLLKIAVFFCLTLFTIYAALAYIAYRGAT